MEGNALRVVTILVVYFAVSGIILAGDRLYVVDVAGVNLVPTLVSLLLLVPIYVWYRYHGQREELSEQIREKGKAATLGTILLLFVLAMSVRIASVLLFNMLSRRRRWSI